MLVEREESLLWWLEPVAERGRASPGLRNLVLLSGDLVELVVVLPQAVEACGGLGDYIS